MHAITVRAPSQHSSELYRLLLTSYLSETSKLMRFNCGWEDATTTEMESIAKALHLDRSVKLEGTNSKPAGQEWMARLEGSTSLPFIEIVRSSTSVVHLFQSFVLIGCSF
uniref:Predicted protein n=1 Tax=Physcomitrium patens TaxID=3218 RepID=A9U2Y2_PHYPA